MILPFQFHTLLTQHFAVHCILFIACTRAVFIHNALKQVFLSNSFCNTFPHAESFLAETAIEELNFQLNLLDDMHRHFVLVAESVPIRGYSPVIKNSTLKQTALDKLTTIAHFLNIPTGPLCQLLIADTSSPFANLIRRYQSNRNVREFVREFFQNNINIIVHINRTFETPIMQNFRYPSADSPIANSDFFNIVSSHFLQFANANSAECHYAMTAALHRNLQAYIEYFCTFCDMLQPKSERLFDSFVNTFSNVENLHAYCDGDMIGIRAKAYYRLIGPNYILLAGISNEEAFAEAYLQIMFTAELAQNVFSDFYKIGIDGVESLGWIRRLVEEEIKSEDAIRSVVFIAFVKFTLERHLIGTFKNPRIFKSVLYKYYQGFKEDIFSQFLKNATGLERESEGIAGLEYMFLMCNRAFVDYDWIIRDEDGLDAILGKIDRWAKFILRTFEHPMQLIINEYKARLEFLKNAQHPQLTQNLEINEVDEIKMNQEFQALVSELLADLIEQERQEGLY